MNVSTCFLKGIVIRIARENVNLIWNMKKFVLRLNLEALQKEFVSMNYINHWFLSFNSSRTNVYLCIYSKALRLNLHALKAFQMLDHCQWQCLTGSVVIIYSPKTELVFRNKCIQKQFYLHTKNLFEYFSNNRQNTHWTKIKTISRLELMP